MIKITLSGAGAAEAPKVIINAKEVGKVKNGNSFEIDIDTKNENIVKLKNLNGSSTPIKVSNASGKDIIINYVANWGNAMREGYFELQNIEGATTQEAIETGNNKKTNYWFLIIMGIIILFGLIGTFVS